MSSGSLRRTLVTLTALLATSAAPCTMAGDWKQVAITVPVPARLQTSPDDRVLVALFRSNDRDRFYPGLEISRWARRELALGTPLTVIDIPPPPIPEQRPEVLAVNDAFWRQLGEDFDADLIIAGVARFEKQDRSGFVTRDQRDPVTGQTVRRTVYAEQWGYELTLEVFFLKGENGALLHEDRYTAERVLLSEQPQEDLQMLFFLLETMTDDLRAVLVPTTRSEPRYIWTE